MSEEPILKDVDPRLKPSQKFPYKNGVFYLFHDGVLYPLDPKSIEDIGGPDELNDGTEIEPTGTIDDPTHPDDPNCLLLVFKLAKQEVAETVDGPKIHEVVIDVAEGSVKAKDPAQRVAEVPAVRAAREQLDVAEVEVHLQNTQEYREALKGEQVGERFPEIPTEKWIFINGENLNTLMEGALVPGSDVYLREIQARMDPPNRQVLRSHKPDNQRYYTEEGNIVMVDYASLADGNYAIFVSKPVKPASDETVRTTYRRELVRSAFYNLDGAELHQDKSGTSADQAEREREALMAMSYLGDLANDVGLIRDFDRDQPKAILIKLQERVNYLQWEFDNLEAHTRFSDEHYRRYREITNRWETRICLDRIAAFEKMDSEPPIPTVVSTAGQPPSISWPPDPIVRTETPTRAVVIDAAKAQAAEATMGERRISEGQKRLEATRGERPLAEKIPLLKETIERAARIDDLTREARQLYEKLMAINPNLFRKKMFYDPEHHLLVEFDENGLLANLETDEKIAAAFKRNSGHYREAVGAITPDDPQMTKLNLAHLLRGWFSTSWQNSLILNQVLKQYLLWSNTIKQNPELSRVATELSAVAEDLARDWSGVNAPVGIIPAPVTLFETRFDGIKKPFNAFQNISTWKENPEYLKVLQSRVDAGMRNATIIEIQSWPKDERGVPNNGDDFHNHGASVVIWGPSSAEYFGVELKQDTEVDDLLTDANYARSKGYEPKGSIGKSRAQFDAAVEASQKDPEGAPRVVMATSCVIKERARNTNKGDAYVVAYVDGIDNKTMRNYEFIPVEKLDEKLGWYLERKVNPGGREGGMSGS
jgi:hypothetical protein